MNVTTCIVLKSLTYPTTSTRFVCIYVDMNVFVENIMLVTLYIEQKLQEQGNITYTGWTMFHIFNLVEDRWCVTIQNPKNYQKINIHWLVQTITFTSIVNLSRETFIYAYKHGQVVSAKRFYLVLFAITHKLLWVIIDLIFVNRLPLNADQICRFPCFCLMARFPGLWSNQHNISLAQCSLAMIFYNTARICSLM